MRIIRIIRRIKVKLIRKFALPPTQISQEERYLIRIVRKLLSMKDSELLMTPNVTKFYINSDKNNDKNGVFVVIDLSSGVTSVINHKFGYDIKMSPRVITCIMNDFTKNVEERRANMEKEYRGNIQYSLSTVLKNINTNIKPKNQNQ